MYLLSGGLACLSTCGQLRAADDPKVILIQMQNAPNSMEPVQQPAAVRVDNRSPVTIRIENLSPLDSCSISRTPAPVTETNPFQALLTAVAGFGSAGMAGSAGLSSAAFEELNEKKSGLRQLQISALSERIRTKSAPKPAHRAIEDDPIYKRFVQVANEYPEKSSKTLNALAAEQTKYDKAAADLLVYLSKDYRGQLWKGFVPRNTLSLPGVAGLVDTPLPGADEIAANQADLDLLTGWQTYLQNAFQTAGSFGDADPVLEFVNAKVDGIKAALSLMGDSYTTLKTSQAGLRTSFQTVLRLSDDFHRRLGEKLEKGGTYSRDESIARAIFTGSNDVLVQEIQLGSDRKSTVTGAVTCVSQTDPKTPTTDTINYSILYQDSVPFVSLSLGTLVTLQPKYVIGTEAVAPNTAGPIFAVTDRERAQIFPMAFVNFHPGNYRFRRLANLGRTKESEVVFSAQITGGIGVNSNSGSNQVEYFLGPTIGIGKIFVHAGAHFGRVEQLGGGYSLNQPAPATMGSSLPLTWHYGVKLSFGVSYRTAPW